MVSRETVAASAAGFGAVKVIAVKKTAATVTNTERKPLSKSAQALQKALGETKGGDSVVLPVTNWETLKALFSACDEIRLSDAVTYPVVMCGETRIITSGQFTALIWNPAVLKKKLPVPVAIRISGRRKRTGKTVALAIPEAKPARSPRAPKATQTPTPPTPTES